MHGHVFLDDTDGTSKGLLRDARIELIDANGIQLDGDTIGDDPASAPLPSGDDVPGGEFRFAFNILPGDVNGDGYDDVIAGAPQSTSVPGYAVVFSGLDGSILGPA